MRLVWCTDVHLDHCPNISMFIDDVLTMEPDQIVLTGDISDANNIVKHLSVMANEWKVPVNFILGNHDFYGQRFVPAKMKDVLKKVNDISEKTDNLNWLAKTGPIKLTEKACLVGNGLWCDWRAGLKDKGSVWLNDYILIEDLLGMPQYQSDIRRIKNKVQKLAKEKTDQLIKHVQLAIDSGYKKIIIGTHVPPWHEASFYNGVIQNDDWAPHFVCQIAGEQLKKIASKNQDVEFISLFGHTHGSSPPPGYVEILPNLRATNGAATYRHPATQTPLIIE